MSLRNPDVIVAIAVAIVVCILAGVGTFVVLRERRYPLRFAIPIAIMLGLVADCVIYNPVIGPLFEHRLKDMQTASK